MKNPPPFNITADESIIALGMLQADQLASVSGASSLMVRRVAVLAGDGVDEAQLAKVQRVLREQGLQVEVVSNRRGSLHGLAGGQVPVDHHWLDMPSVMFDAVYIPGGEASVAALLQDLDAVTFVQQAYEHGKSVAATGEGVALLKELGLALPLQAGDPSANGVVADAQDLDLARVIKNFLSAIVKDRHWRRGVESFDAIAPMPLSSRQGSVGFGPM